MSSPVSWVVLKFGGTSVSSRARWDTLAAVVRTRRQAGLHPFVVCSAVSGVTDALDALVNQAVQGNPAPALSTIRDRHIELGRELGVDAADVLAGPLDALERLAQGIALLQHATPQLRARVMAHGELMSTRLGMAYLSEQGLNVAWRDARTLLRAQVEPHASARRTYLNASCAATPDADLQRDLSDSGADLVLTQGFIARNPAGETVLIGRGGSDTSAAYFAVKLQAERLEIWTDVPGLFSADPRHVPGARLLQHLSYNEAQELATMGASVLHPRCIDPVRQHHIPLHVRSTEAPHLNGTVLSADVSESKPHLKAISAKTGVTLISMSTIGMWQQVGFLADVFAVFKRHGLSIDLVATSEANVTVSLDTISNTLDAATLEAVRADLSEYCTVDVIVPCAAVSLVGRDIRSILHELSPAFKAINARHIRLMTQAASDLNITLVVDEDQATTFVARLHEQLLEDTSGTSFLGPAWTDVQAGSAGKTT